MGGEEAVAVVDLLQTLTLSLIKALTLILIGVPARRDGSGRRGGTRVYSSRSSRSSSSRSRCSSSSCGLIYITPGHAGRDGRRAAARPAARHHALPRLRREPASRGAFSQPGWRIASAVEYSDGVTLLLY